MTATHTIVAIRAQTYAVYLHWQASTASVYRFLDALNAACEGGPEARREAAFVTLASAYLGSSSFVRLPAGSDAAATAAQNNAAATVFAIERGAGGYALTGLRQDGAWLEADGRAAHRQAALSGAAAAAVSAVVHTRLRELAARLLAPSQRAAA